MSAQLASESSSPSMSSTSILSQQSSLPSSLSSSIPSIPPDQIADSEIVKEKVDLDLLLNTSMTQLHTKFGRDANQQIQQEIHKKLNALKLLVSVIEKRAQQKHVEIDVELDEAQSALKTQTKLQHQQLENERNEKLNTIYSHFRKWIDSNLSDPNQSQPQSPASNPFAQLNTNQHNNGNIVIITDSNNNVMNAFIVQNQSNTNNNENE